jgi:hypothetical protein
MQITHTNDSSQYQIVGNASVVLSSHPTEQAAKDVYFATDYSEHQFGVVEIVSPGKTIIRQMSDPMTADELAKLESVETEDIFGFGLAAE